VKNILSIDLEDWHQLIHRRITGRALPPTDGVRRQLDRLLGLLQAHDTKATFFALGMLAEAYPDLIKLIAAQGHEIASHGYDHRSVHGLSRSQFAEDTRRAKGVLEDLLGKPVRGYRAAEFSILGETLWAFEVLAELGFEYDSSVFPIHHRRYGIAGFCPRAARYDLRNGLQLVEIPLATISFGKFNVPVAGGGYFRIMPLWLICRAVRRLNAERAPMVAYLHPYEFDPRSLNIFESFRPRGWTERLRGVRVNLVQNLGRHTMPRKLAGLLSRFRFTTCKDYLESADLRERQALFSAASR
jgi:polysaccharide deacetylase family protein (PEP-CTERM system associated)